MKWKIFIDFPKSIVSPWKYHLIRCNAIMSMFCSILETVRDTSFRGSLKMLPSIRLSSFESKIETVPPKIRTVLNRVNQVVVARYHFFYRYSVFENNRQLPRLRRKISFKIAIQQDLQWSKDHFLILVLGFSWRGVRRQMLKFFFETFFVFSSFSAFFEVIVSLGEISSPPKAFCDVLNIFPTGFLTNCFLSFLS